MRPKKEYLKSKYDDTFGNRSSEDKIKKNNLRLSSKAVKSVLEFYKTDFEAFNYSSDYFYK